VNEEKVSALDEVVEDQISMRWFSHTRSSLPTKAVGKPWTHDLRGNVEDKEDWKFPSRN
jgi:hypothetical protein